MLSLKVLLEKRVFNGIYLTHALLECSDEHAPLGRDGDRNLSRDDSGGFGHGGYCTGD